jgi:hypothetical protein
VTGLARAFDAQLRLIRLQREWMPRLQGAPLAETVVSLLSRSAGAGGGAGTEERELAASIRDQFGVSDRRWRRWRLEALARGRDWEGMRRMARERGGGLQPRHFAEACLRQGCPDEALDYAVKTQDAEVRLDLFVRMQEWQAAADLAMELGPAAQRRLLRMKEMPGPVRANLVQQQRVAREEGAGDANDGDPKEGGFSVGSFGARQFEAAATGLLSRMSVWGRGGT